MEVKILWIIFCVLGFQDTAYSLFFKYGPLAGDFVYEGDDVCEEANPISTGSSFRFLGTAYSPNTVSACTNGVITLDDIDTQNNTRLRGSFPNATAVPGIGVLFHDWYVFEDDSVMFIRLETSEAVLADIDTVIRAVESDYGSSSVAFLASWINVEADYDSSIKATFQAVLATDDVHTFLINNYKSISPAANGTSIAIGFGNGTNQPEFYDHPYSFSEDGIFNLLDHSNVGEPGRWIYRVDSADTSVYPNNRGITSGTPSNDIEYEDIPDIFFKYGITVGDIYDEADSGEVDFDTSNFTFFDTDYHYVSVNIDGTISFLDDNNDYSYFLDYDDPVVAAFGDDLDCGDNIGMVYGRYVTNGTDLDDIDDVLRGNVPYTRTKRAVIGSWVGVPQYGLEESSSLTFQAVIATDEFSTYVIFHYHQFTNFSFEENDGDLAVGFDLGDETNFWEHPHGGLRYQNLITESNAGVPGRWIYSIHKPMDSGRGIIEYDYMGAEGELEVRFTITNMAYDADLEDPHTDAYKELYWDMTDIILDAVNIKNAVIRSMIFTDNVDVICVLGNAAAIAKLDNWVEAVLKEAVDSGDFGNYDVDRDSIDVNPDDNNAVPALMANFYMLVAACLLSMWKRLF